MPGTAKVSLLPTFSDVCLHLGYLIPFFKDAVWINPAYWTLAIEFQYYIVLALLFPFLVKSRLSQYLMWMLFIGFSLISSNSKLFFSWAIYFYIGINYVLWLTKKTALFDFILQTFILLFLSWYLYDVIDFMLAVLFLIVVHFCRDFNPPVFKFLGKISFSLYLLHFVFGSPIVNFFLKYCTHSFLKIILVLVALGLSILSSWFFYLWVEKPSMRLASRVKR